MTPASPGGGRGTVRGSSGWTGAQPRRGRQIMRKAILTLLVVALGTSTAPAQGWAEKMFKEGLTHDFGTVPRGAQLFHKFTITNIYAVRMEITQVKSGCGCVTATATKRVL